MAIKEAFMAAMRTPKMRNNFIIMAIGCVVAFLIPIFLRGTKLMTPLLIVDALIVYAVGNNFSTEFACYVAMAQENEENDK